MELIRCLKSIKEHAFSASPYPVVITLEDHLTPDLQAKVAQVSFYYLLLCLLSSVVSFLLLLVIEMFLSNALHVDAY